MGIMDHYRGKTSAFFSKLADGLGTEQRPTFVPLSESLGPPGPQTCHSTSSRISSPDKNSIFSRPTFAVFEFPDELILSVLSCISPDLEPTGHYARFRSQYNMDISDYHRRRVAFLLPLSMTCRAMRLRLLPWIWGRIEAFSGISWNRGSESLMRRPKVIVFFFFFFFFCNHHFYTGNYAYMVITHHR
jgi:hypothetical protein